MTNFITSYQDWIEEYKKDKYKTWIRATLSNDSEVYLVDYSEWLALKSHCESNKLKVQKVGLQYKSHSIEVDTDNCDGVYLAQSIIGFFGESTKKTYTIGKLYGRKIKKTIWIIPELIKQLDDEDDVENSFEEALIYDYTQKRET